MAYQSPVYQQGKKQYYQPTQGGDFAYIQDPNQRSSLAKQGVIKAGAQRQTLPTNARIAGQPAKPLTEPPAQSGVAPEQPSKPQIGSQTAFNLVFGQLMGHATKLQGLQDQKNKLLLQLYDRQLTPEELRTLSPSQQQAIREGNKNLLEYQVMSLNDIIKGRADQNTQALQYMMEGYQADQQELERKKTTAYNTTLALINKFGDLSGLSQQSRDAVARGEMPTQEDLIKLGRTLKEQQLATKKEDTQVVEVGKKKMLINMQTGQVIKDLGTAPSSMDGALGSIPIAPAGVPPTEKPKQTFDQFLTQEEQKAGQSFSSTKRGTLKKQFEAQQKLIVKEPDISKFDPTVQMVIRGMKDIDSIGEVEYRRVKNQLNQAIQMGLIGKEVTLSKDKRQIVNQMQSQIRQDLDIKNFIEIRDGYERVQTGAELNNAQGDLSLLFGYMKLLDPTSVVRETEFANAEAAMGYAQQVLNLPNKAIQGNRLTQKARRDFSAAANALYKRKKASYDKAYTFYENQAKQSGVDPNLVLRDFGTTIEEFDPLGIR